jgi:hypothetical protein
MTDKLNIYYQNCRGLRSKTNEFKLNVACNFYDIICLNETWLMDSVFDGQLFDDRYIVFRRDRDLNFHQKLDGGGVLIAVFKSKFEKVQRFSNFESGVEDIFLKCSTNNFTVCISCAYIKPQTDIDNLREHLDSLERFCLENSESSLIVAGDYNAPHLEDISRFTSNSVYSSLRNSFSTCNLTQFNRTLNENNVILDLILSNKDVKVEKAEDSLVKCDSHHPALEFSLSSYNFATVNDVSQKRNFFKGNYSLIRNKIMIFSWSIAFSSCNNVDQMLEVFYSVIFQLIDQFIPMKGKRNANFPHFYSKNSINLFNLKKKEAQERQQIL